MTVAPKIHDVLTTADLEYSGLSWDGFNLFGDWKSIDEARRLLHEASTVPALQNRIKQCTNIHADDTTEIERLRAALERLLFWNEGIKAGRGNHHPQDHINVIRTALGMPAGDAPRE